MAASDVDAATVVGALVESLARLGVREAYGVSGGAIAALWHTLSASRVRVCHFRHESGAAFAAAEASCAGNRPVLVFATTGPGLVNALTGLMAARDVGARIVLISGYTPASGHGRHAIQETSPRTMPAALHATGEVFDHAGIVAQPAMLGPTLQTVARGFLRPGGFVAHVAIPIDVQTLPAIPFDLDAAPSTTRDDLQPAESVDRCLQALAGAPFAIWAGAGAQGAATQVRAFAERSGAAVFCTPRGKGVVPETHPRCIGVTGMGGHGAVPAWLQAHRPARILVLGSRLGEASSGWDRRFVPPGGFVHVDVDAAAFGAAYPEAPCIPVQAEIGALMRGLLEAWPGQAAPAPAWTLPTTTVEADVATAPERVHPRALMAALQRQVVDGSDAVLLAESGNAFIWTTHCLRFDQARRYRVSTGFGAMGHAAAGVVGAALATGRSAVAVVGDGAMLMTNEIHTAAKYQVRAVWVVLNDARYGMCAQGMQTLGLRADATFPAVDFVAFARAQGADGIRVTDASQLDAALRRALAAEGPCLVDVAIDPAALAPSAARNRALASELRADLSFPPQ